MIGRRLRRWIAEWRLVQIDAEIAHWFVDDGTLSLAPLDHPAYAQDAVTPRASIRRSRLAAVRRLEAAGGRDPWPTVMREPRQEQRAAYLHSRR